MPDPIDLPATLTRPERIVTASRFVADALNQYGVAHIECTPGDATRYEIVIVDCDRPNLRAGATLVTDPEFGYVSRGWCITVLAPRSHSWIWDGDTAPTWHYLLGKVTPDEHTAKVVAAIVADAWNRTHA